MKKMFGIFIGVLIALVAGIWVSGGVGAAGFYKADDKGDVVIASGDKVDSTAYIAANRIIVDGSIQGDLFCAGDTITINGTVNGDVICAGSKITINGSVNGNVRVAASEVTLAGVVQNNALVVGSTIVTQDKFNVGGDFTGGGERMTLAGTFGRDVLAGGTTISLAGTVGRDVSTYVENFTVADNARIAGNVYYRSDNRSDVPDQAVQGNVSHDKTTTVDNTSMDIGGLLLGLLMLITLALVGVLVMPRFVHIAASLPPRDVLLAFLIGFVAILLLPFVGIVLAVSMVGILVGFALLLVWLLAIVASSIFVSYYVGTLVLRQRGTNALLVALTGSAILGVLLLIPFINVLVFILMVCIGVGMQLMHIRYQFSKKPYTITA